MHRLVELNYKLGLLDEANKYAAVLGYNYQSSQWYEAYKKLLIKIMKKFLKKKDIKKQKSILKKFKDIFK